MQLVETALEKAGIQPPFLPETPDAVIRPPVDASTPQWFHFEGRDPGWAAAVERGLAGIVQRDLRAVNPAVEAVAVECKSRVCRLRFRSGTERHAANFVKQVYGAELRPARAGADDQAYLNLRDGRNRDLVRTTAEESLARLGSRRASLLFSLRTGRVKPETDLPLARLPRD